MIAEEAFGSSAHNRLGHHGLFFDRLDAGAPSAALAVNARGLYHSRNRSYDPRLGRFTSEDPHNTSAIVQRAPDPCRRLITDSPGFDTIELYVDGLNAYAYLGCGPLNRQDPMGLNWAEGASPLDMVLFEKMAGILANVQVRLGAMMVEHYAKLTVAAELVYGATNPNPGASLGFNASIRLVGKTGEDILASLGGAGQVRVPTSLGTRIIDRIVGVLAYEVKTGWVELTPTIRRQAMKDAEIVRMGGTAKHDIQQCVWLFVTNPYTGKQGCAPELRKFLEGLGIQVIEVFRSQ